jgi:hypothetical protein
MAAAGILINVARQGESGTTLRVAGSGHKTAGSGRNTAGTARGR